MYHRERASNGGCPIGAKRYLLEFVVLVVAIVVSVVGEYLWHHAIDLIEITFGPYWMARRLHETIQTETIDLVKITFDGCHIAVARDRSNVFLTLWLFGRVVQIMCVMLQSIFIRAEAVIKFQFQIMNRCGRLPVLFAVRLVVLVIVPKNTVFPIHCSQHRCYVFPSEPSPLQRNFYDPWVDSMYSNNIHTIVAFPPARRYDVFVVCWLECVNIELWSN